MRKKTPRSGKKRNDFSLLLSLGIVALFLLLVATWAILSPKSQPPCANSESCINDLSGRKEADDQGVFMGQTVYVPRLSEEPSSRPEIATSVLGEQTGDYKHIYVDLTNQRLYAFEGN